MERNNRVHFDSSSPDSFLLTMALSRYPANEQTFKHESMVRKFTRSIIKEIKNMVNLMIRWVDI